jgi:hypothetical protein
MTNSSFDRQQLKHLEDSLTPAEIARIIEDPKYQNFPFAIRPLLQNGQAPTSYLRDSWCENANYYTANRGGRSLLVAFCGSTGRLGVSSSYFLQMLRDDLYDVLILNDPQRLHFDRGIPGFSSSFIETIRRIEDFAAAVGFQEVITFGASMGGFPSLRAGLMLNARRAVCIGGRYCWHVGRLMRAEKQIKAFDTLCYCNGKSNVQMVAIVARKNQEDVQNLEMMRRTFPSCRALMIDTDMHNVTGYFRQAGLLRLFYACLFEYWEHTTSGAELLPLLAGIARPINAYGVQQAEQVLSLRRREADAQKQLCLIKERSEASLQQERVAHLRKLQTVYASRSWRLTQPLRMLSQLLRKR